MDIEKELINNQVLLSIFSKEYYNESIFETLKELKDKRICYVTLNKPSSSLQRSFKFFKIPTKNMFFIDAVSQGLGKGKEEENVLMVSSPAALTELSVAIGESVKSRVFDVMLFDSLSTLNIYELGNRTERFTYHVINKIKSEDRKGIFTCLEDDVNTNLIKNLFMYVDKALRFTEFYESLRKRRHNTAFVALFAIALLASLSFLKFPTLEHTVTGLNILSNTSIKPGTLPLLISFLISLTIIGFVAVYKIMSLKPIPTSKLLAIKPLKKNPAKLKKDFKSKIHNWFEKIK